MNRMRDGGTGYYGEDRCDLAEFASLTSKTLAPDQAPRAASIERNIPVYNIPGLADMLVHETDRRTLMAEWADILLNTAGVMVLKGAAADLGAIDEATAIYMEIIAREKAQKGGGGDHFAKAGANDRIWNSLQKLCEASPSVFARYFASPAIDAVCEAWLGPNYQMTAQVNLVHPGGAAQQAHRDYHLGFQTAELSAAYPAHVHELSPLLTLQGAVAHCDMPVESGPTKLLPFSQAYKPGYAAWRRDDFRAWFEERHVQLPLEKGDALFFNPALFHAAGANNSTNIERMANLLQISSPFGRAMESIDRGRMSVLLYPELARLRAKGTLSVAQVKAVVAACAEGYSFPTNLDSDPPIGGLAPETQAQLLHRALTENWEESRLAAALAEQDSRRRP